MKIKRQIRMELLVLIVLIVVILLIVISKYTIIGQDIMESISSKFESKTEVITIEEPKKIKLTYVEKSSMESFDIEVSDDELIKMIVDNISNKELFNETKAGIMLMIFGEYRVDLENDISFKFDDYNKEGYIKIHTPEKEFITKINPEVLKKIKDIVDTESEAMNWQVFVALH